MAKNNNEDFLQSMDGERGIPSANETGGINRAQKLGFVLLVLVCLAVMSALYYYNHRKKEALEEAQAAIADDNSLPSRTFDLPSSPKPELPASVPALPASVPALPVDVMQPPVEPPMLDKSSTSLMAESSGASQASGARSGDSRPAGLGRGEQSKLDLSRASLIASHDRNLLITKGTFLDCALQTKLVSTVQGMTACVLTRNIYSDNGKVLLLERGSQVIGEYKANVQQGDARIFVLWTRIKTPNGVIVNIDSPGTDPLGASGLPGYVDTHFWKRFGGAIMLSMVDDGFAYMANTHGRGQNNYENSQANSQTMAHEALRNSINIPPTLYINQGAHINIYVAKDLDFSEVYDVRAIR